MAKLRCGQVVGAQVGLLEDGGRRRDAGDQRKSDPPGQEPPQDAEVLHQAALPPPDGLSMVVGFM